MPDVVILAVPADAVAQIADEFGQELNGKILIEVTNRMNLGDPGAVLDGTSTAEALQSRVPAPRVVKAFNTVLAARQVDPVVDRAAGRVVAATTPRRRTPCCD